MKRGLRALIILLLVGISGCTDKKEEILNAPPKTWSSESMVPGKVGIVFNDNITENEAVKLLVKLNLTIAINYGFGTNGRHSIVVNVEVGLEQIWIDTLKKYQEVKSANILMVAVEE